MLSDRLASGALTERTFHDGEPIVREGETGREMFVIRSGGAEVRRRGLREPVARLAKGDFFGEMALLESQPRDADVVAVGTTRVLVLGPGPLLVQLRRDPSFALELLQALSGRVRRLNEQLRQLGEEPAVDATRVILGAAEERLVVVSDLHLGSPASNADRAFPAFLDEVAAGGFALCINGDGFDVLQSSTVALATTGFPILRRLHDLAAAGTRVYYVLGNHDHVLEHVLFDLPFTVMPFFNLRSGGRLIRIEHGHVHEPFYARYPGIYELGGRLGRLALLAHADAYQWWARAQQYVDDRRRRHGEATRYPHHLAAEALFQRGFDAAVFGHTHQPEVRELDGGTFVNGGDWLHHRTFVRIDAGELSLAEWEPGALLQGRTT